MWRKIHSNRDPRDTLYSEIRKEFEGYFAVGTNAGKRLLSAYPKFIFGCMVVLMALSMVLSFTIFRHPEPAKVPATKKVSPIEDGFSQIIQATGNIRETMRLKILVDSLTSKRQLSREDSTLLDSALDRLARMNKIRTGR